MAPPLPVPEVCSVITTPWPLTLQDAIALHARAQPHQRYMKRMRIAGAKSSLTDFLVKRVAAPAVKLPPLTPAPRLTSVSPAGSVTTSAALDDEAMREALQRREEYMEDDNYCEPCNKQVIFNSREASCVCVRCGDSRNHNPVDTSFREGTSLHQPYLYKQSNHFRDHLKRIQARESTIIPEEVLLEINAELDKRGDDRSDITPDDIRLILKSLGHSKLYNHTMRIWSVTTGKSPPTMTPHQEQELLHLFTLIQDPWSRVKPKGRSNMLSYTYLLRKLCGLLGYEELGSHFKTLKSKDKLMNQDLCWKAICNELDFDFEPSLL